MCKLSDYLPANQHSICIQTTRESGTALDCSQNVVWCVELARIVPAPTNSLPCVTSQGASMVLASREGNEACGLVALRHSVAVFNGICCCPAEGCVVQADSTTMLQSERNQLQITMEIRGFQAVSGCAPYIDVLKPLTQCLVVMSVYS